MTTLIPVLLLAALAPDDPPTLADVLARASAYVVKFELAFSSVVAEERYTQLLTNAGGAFPGGRRATDTQRRALKADFLLVRSEQSDGWVPFRDVFEVDGQPLREREDRLMKLFVEASGAAYDQARRISDESSRYNIGPVLRTVNQPLLSLKFLVPAHLRSSSFEKVGETRMDGIPVWEVRFEEVGIPTLIRTRDDMDLPAEGQLWIDPATGTVLKSQIRCRTQDLRAELTVTFRAHEDLDLHVPVELKEKYVGPGYELEGTATYSRLRRFRVTTEEAIEPQE